MTTTARLPGMIDTQVLVYAVRGGRKGDPVDLAAMCTASRDLVSRLAQLHMSSLSWLELLRGARDSELHRFQAVRARLHLLDVSGRVAERAHELLVKRNVAEKVCERCGSSKKSAPCKTCGVVVSHQQRLNDALITSTAELDEAVPTLFTYDGGIHDFAAHIDPNRLRIERPPNPSGPLFER